MKSRALWERPVSYGAVGATQADDLMQHPPVGFRAITRRVRLGFGDARWEYAWTQTLTWGVQRMSGMIVHPSDAPAAVTDMTYTPVVFDDNGVPVEPATTDAGGHAVYAPDGTAFIKPGDSANVVIPVGPLKFSAPVRVVYVVDEPQRKGFGYGTLVGHPESGEEAWIVERTDDGSVWLTIRAFSRPSRWFWWIAYPGLRVMQAIFTRRYERSLAGPIAE
ncbi:DUF1990 domain-containing protein [Glaciihabitans sp. dw_435]|uniref:DUF1990 family protein n=1 Tax=Glaciihabitans sp. dw_435 TaxID=2720081 RepID=UPI0027DC78B6|nr:DUF1990 domain-containing protein [Glaciihabitans sp. dw_435]